MQLYCFSQSFKSCLFCVRLQIRSKLQRLLLNWIFATKLNCLGIIRTFDLILSSDHSESIILLSWFYWLKLFSPLFSSSLFNEAKKKIATNWKLGLEIDLEQFTFGCLSLFHQFVGHQPVICCPSDSCCLVQLFYFVLNLENETKKPN